MSTEADADAAAQAEADYTADQYQADTNAEIDFDDPMTAFYTGCRELGDEEYAAAAAAHRADVERALDARAADDAYAAWAAEHPDEHAAAVADHEARVEAQLDLGAEPF
jgi:hypothetical protein